MYKFDILSKEERIYSYDLSIGGIRFSALETTNKIRINAKRSNQLAYDVECAIGSN